MELKLKFDMGNAAFEDGNAASECARILTEIAGTLEDRFTMGTDDGGTIRDINGNKIGTWAVVAPKPVYYWMYDSKCETVTVYQMQENGEPKVIVPWTERGYRDGKQAVREELVKLGLMKAPDQAASGGKKWHNDVELHQL